MAGTVLRDVEVGAGSAKPGSGSVDAKAAVVGDTLKLVEWVEYVKESPLGHTVTVEIVHSHMDLDLRSHTDYHIHSDRELVGRWWEPSCHTCCLALVESQKAAADAGNMEMAFG